MTRPSVRVVVRASPIHGRGVFAKDPIEAGTVVERCPLLYLGPDDIAAGTTLMDYVFDAGEGGSWLALGLTSLINHHDEPNAEVEIDAIGQRLSLRTIMDIDADEELFIDYGPTYFSDRGYE